MGIQTSQQICLATCLTHRRHKNYFTPTNSTGRVQRRNCKLNLSQFIDSNVIVLVLLLISNNLPTKNQHVPNSNMLDINVIGHWNLIGSIICQFITIHIVSTKRNHFQQTNDRNEMSSQFVLKLLLFMFNFCVEPSKLFSLVIYYAFMPKVFHSMYFEMSSKHVNC